MASEQRKGVGDCSASTVATHHRPNQSSLFRRCAWVSTIAEGQRFEYRFSVRDERERHDWSLIGPAGAIGIWAEPTSDRSWGDRWFGGVEVHYAECPDYLSERSRHNHCWLLQRPCWHDGSSLFFSERIEPNLPEPTGGQIGPEFNAFILFHLRDWFDDKLASADTHPKDGDSTQIEAPLVSGAVPPQAGDAQ